MEKIPDYSTYSLEELYDVANHINREAWPARYLLVVQWIEKREAEPVQEHIPSREDTPVKQRASIPDAAIILGCFKGILSGIATGIVAGIALFVPLALYEYKYTGYSNWGNAVRVGLWFVPSTIILSAVTGAIIGVARVRQRYYEADPDQGRLPAPVISVVWRCFKGACFGTAIGVVVGSALFSLIHLWHIDLFSATDMEVAGDDAALATIIMGAVIGTINGIPGVWRYQYTVAPIEKHTWSPIRDMIWRIVKETLSGIITGSVIGIALLFQFEVFRDDREPASDSFSALCSLISVVLLPLTVTVIFEAVKEAVNNIASVWEPLPKRASTSITAVLRACLKGTLFGIVVGILVGSALVCLIVLSEIVRVGHANFGEAIGVGLVPVFSAFIGAFAGAIHGIVSVSKREVDA